MTARFLACAAALALVLGCTNGSATPAPTPSPTPSPSIAAGIPSSTPSPAPSPRPYALQQLGTFSNPVWVGAAPGDQKHLYLVEKTGRVLQLDANGKPLGVVLDLRTTVSRGNEQGLLSIAFDPGFATNHRMYVNYTDKAGDTQVVVYTVTGGKAIKPQVLFFVDQPYPNHNGGLLLFDPTGMLLVGLGDGGSAGDPHNYAQNLFSDLGKILRIDPRTGLGAPGNPYRSNPRVWALGLRQPWRFSFDTNGDFYVGDVGQSNLEELDVVAPAHQNGANYGWSVYEGTERIKLDQGVTLGELITPALVYLHAHGGCSITGGEVYRGKALPALVGSYVFGDFCSGHLLRTTRTATGVTPSQRLGVEVDGLQAFGHDAHGELLVMSSDTLYRLTAAVLPTP